MNGFYASMVFFGILLVVFSLICIFLDKKKTFGFMKSYEDKKRELVEIISDAEQMIEELNRFSDYIVNQMDLKNEEMSKNLKIAEKKVSALSNRAMVICNGAEEAIPQESGGSMKSGEEAPVAEVLVTEAPVIEIPAIEIPAAVAVNGGAIDTAGIANAAYFKINSDFIAVSAKKSEKVIPINNKYSEVIRLSHEGMQGLEIAKRLNMGKGEVDLILGLRK